MAQAFSNRAKLDGKMRQRRNSSYSSSRMPMISKIISWNIEHDTVNVVEKKIMGHLDWMS